MHSSGQDSRAPAAVHELRSFGDSITDGTHTTVNINDRWMNAVSRRLHNAYGTKVSIVNEAIGGNRVVNPVPPNSTSGPAAVDRLDRETTPATTPSVWWWTSRHSPRATPDTDTDD